MTMRQGYIIFFAREDEKTIEKRLNESCERQAFFTLDAELAKAMADQTEYNQKMKRTSIIFEVFFDDEQLRDMEDNLNGEMK